MIDEILCMPEFKINYYEHKNNKYYLEIELKEHPERCPKNRKSMKGMRRIMKEGTLKAILSMKLPSIEDYNKELRVKYSGCYYNSFSEIRDIEQLPHDIQHDIMELSRKYTITLLQAKQCCMATGRSEQTDMFCETLRDKGEFIFEIARAQYFAEQFKKQSQALRLLCNNYRKMHGLPLIRRRNV